MVRPRLNFESEEARREYQRQYQREYHREYHREYRRHQQQQQQQTENEREQQRITLNQRNGQIYGRRRSEMSVAQLETNEREHTNV